MVAKIINQDDPIGSHMNSELYEAIKNGELILFLGAGASRECTDRSGSKLLDGGALAKSLAELAHYEYDGEPLDEVYAAVRTKLASRLNAFLESLFRDAQPSQEYRDLATFAWRRIYTLNIDDALEAAIRRSCVQKLHVRVLGDSVADRDNFFDRLDLVKLNGSVDQLNSGIIFSSSE